MPLSRAILPSRRLHSKDGGIGMRRRAIASPRYVGPMAHLTRAVVSLATGSETLRIRLPRVHPVLINIRAADLPDALRDDFEWVMKRLTARPTPQRAEDLGDDRRGQRRGDGGEHHREGGAGDRWLVREAANDCCEGVETHSGGSALEQAGCAPWAPECTP